jgi:hypothetical protein
MTIPQIRAACILLATATILANDIANRLPA